MIDAHAKLQQKLDKAQEENSLLRFSNEVVTQMMGDVRGKFIAKLQTVVKEKKDIEGEIKGDTEAWKELVNTTIKQQTEMAEKLQKAMQRIKLLQQELDKKNQEAEKK